jgi:hypothetical protein
MHGPTWLVIGNCENLLFGACRYFLPGHTPRVPCLNIAIVQRFFDAVDNQNMGMRKHQQMCPFNATHYYRKWIHSISRERERGVFGIEMGFMV